MYRITFLAAGLVLVTSSGCVPVLIGGAFYADAKKRESRQQFMADFNQTNAEREKNGLEPLDLCSERYQYDRSWAMEDGECRARIKAYEGGDKTALRIGGGSDKVLTAGDVTNPDEAALICDVRIIRVSDASVIGSASGQAPRERMADLAKALAEKLMGEILVHGEAIAVVSLCNRSGSASGRECADELADKLTGALVETAWFDVKERIELRTILQEKDLETAGVVQEALAREKMTGVKYVVIGGVTVGAAGS